MFCETGTAAVDDNGESELDFPPCVIQFIVFPPQGVRESLGEDFEESDIKLEKYSIAVEVWMEPQYGLCRTIGTPCVYLNNLVYKQVPEKVSKEFQSQFFLPNPNLE